MFTAFRFLFSSTIATVLVTGIQLAASARPATLCGQDPGSAVNIREAASLSARVIGTAKVGDRVNTLDEGIGGETTSKESIYAVCTDPANHQYVRSSVSQTQRCN
ncbi:SH3 domain-containing protein [Phormidesmis sp. 146-33]